MRKEKDRGECMTDCCECFSLSVVFYDDESDDVSVGSWLRMLDEWDEWTCQQKFAYAKNQGSEMIILNCICVPAFMPTLSIYMLLTFPSSLPLCVSAVVF